MKNNVYVCTTESLCCIPETNNIVYQLLIVVVQSLSHVRLFVTTWTVACQLCTRGFPGKNNGVDCHFLLQEIFPTQGLTLVSSIVGRCFTI